MNILVIESNQAVFDRVLSDERMVNFRRLMEFGCYGRLGMRSQGNKWRTRLWEKLQAGGLRMAVLGGPCYEKPEDFSGIWEECGPEKGLPGNQNGSSLTLRFEAARQLMQKTDWQTFYLVSWHLAGGWPFIDPLQGHHSDAYIHLDRGLESLLEVLEEETAVLLLFYSGRRENGGTPAGSFILAVPDSAVEGEVIGATMEDLLVTLIELGEGQVSPELQGRSLFSKKPGTKMQGADLSLDEEAILRERLSGLGYLG